MPNQDDWVAVAAVLRPHGLRGVFRLKPLTRAPEDFLEAPLENLRVRRSGRVAEELKLVESRLVGNGLIHATFEGISDRTTAEKFVNCELVIPEADRWELPEGEYYIDDFAGLEVRDSGSGEPLGTVKTAREGAAHDYLVLKLAGVAEETLLPILPQFVQRVDIAGGFVEVTIPEGLTD